MADILQMHDLKPAPGANKDRIRVGRGEGSKGKTSGRGDKGTKKRYQVRPGLRRWPAAAVHAPSEAAWLQEPVQEGIPGRQRGCSCGTVPAGRRDHRG